MRRELLFSKFGLLVIAVVAVAAIGLANTSIKTARVDLTENKLYTIADGSKNIIRGLKNPVELKFFFSDQLSQKKPELGGIRNYAQRVKELLREFELLSDGKITLSIVDPEPFSEAEDQAAELGIQAVPISIASDGLYFGLAAIASNGEEKSIAFFQPEREEFLEYEVSEIIAKLGQEKVPVVGLMSSLSINGGFDMATRQATPKWMVAQAIEGAFELEPVPITADRIEDNIDILMIVHPKELSDQTLYAIDQFVLGGGKAMVFVDPHAELDTSSNPMQADPATHSQSSQLDILFDRWGVQMLADKVLGDAENAMSVGVQRGAPPVRHIGLQSFKTDNFAADNIATTQLETINVASAGILLKKPAASTEFVPVIQSSELSMPLDAALFKMLRDPRDLAREFKSDDKRYTVAARIMGEFETAFPDGPPKDADADAAALSAVESNDQLMKSQGMSHVLIVADSDILSDRLWVRVQEFLGRRIAQAWAGNSDFVLNSLEQMAGSADLISIRSRGQFSRPFTVVEELQQEAQTRFQAKEQELNQQLAATEQKLAELQRQKEGESVLELSTDQQDAIEQFRVEKLSIRKQLREVRHQLDEDIRALGEQLKLINILLIPAVLTILALAFGWVRSRKAV